MLSPLLIVSGPTCQPPKVRLLDRLSPTTLGGRNFWCLLVWYLSLTQPCQPLNPFLQTMQVNKSPQIFIFLCWKRQTTLAYTRSSPRGWLLLAGGAASRGPLGASVARLGSPFAGQWVLQAPRNLLVPMETRLPRKSRLSLSSLVAEQTPSTQSDVFWKGCSCV